MRRCPNEPGPAEQEVTTSGHSKKSGATAQLQKKKSIPPTRTACLKPRLNNLTPHSTKGDFYFMLCTLSYTDFFCNENTNTTREKKTYFKLCLRQRERLIYQLCTAPCSTRYFLSLEKSSVGGMVLVSDVTI